MNAIIKITKLLIITLICFIQFGWALEYTMPKGNDTVIGKMTRARIGWGDTFHTIGRRFDVGFDYMANANPQFNSAELPLFYHVTVPQKFILPNTSHKGIVINLAQKRLFYYDKKDNKILTFPVGIGKIGWGTPLGTMHIAEKIKNPSWYAPKNILKTLAKEGYTDVPAVIHPGPQDPLGDYALRLSHRMYLIHGTNDPVSIGTQASSGCIRLFAENIEQLFNAVPVGTEVRIIDQPYLIGWNKKELYLAVFPLLNNQKPVELNRIRKSILREVRHKKIDINWRTVAYVDLNKTGIPTAIGKMQ